jgi:hypothetical protein
MMKNTFRLTDALVLTEEMIKGLEQRSFICGQHIMWVYKIQEVLQKKT